MRGANNLSETQYCTQQLFAREVAAAFKIGNFLQFPGCINCNLLSCRFKKRKDFISLCSGKHQVGGGCHRFPWSCPTYLCFLLALCRHLIVTPCALWGALSLPRWEQGKWKDDKKGLCCKLSLWALGL